jgi:NADH:ubiquinone oxidoreductase subunit 6 (subunit J)
VSESTKLIACGLAVLAALVVLGVLAQFSHRPVETFMFYVFGGTMVLSSLAIVLTKNIVRAAVWLLGTLGSAAGLYLLLAANFLAAIQLIVYVGGILILIVFGVMLTGRSPFLRFAPRTREVALATTVGVTLLIGLLVLLLGRTLPEIPGAEPHPLATSVRELGRRLLTDYLVPFELVSVLLLAVMIGAAYLARPTRS